MEKFYRFMGISFIVAFYVFVFFMFLLFLTESIGAVETVGVGAEPEDFGELAGYTWPFIMTVVLGIIYKIVPNIPDRFKSVIAIVIGIGLGLITIAYEGMGFSFVTITGGVLAGLMTGAAAVGIYEATRSVTNPRE